MIYLGCIITLLFSGTKFLFLSFSHMWHHSSPLDSILALSSFESASSCVNERKEIIGAGTELQVLEKSKMDYTHVDIFYDTLVYNSIHDIHVKGQHMHV